MSAVRSEVNRDVRPAAPGEFPALRVGELRVDPPVVLAPMAGVTNAPFRALCRRFGAALYVSEMVTARALVEGDRKTLELAAFAPDEKPRSLQLYGVDPSTVGEAAAALAGEGRVDHLDLNFGCPVRKVTRRGGGAALPLKRRLLRAIVRSAVRAAGEVPVTVKFRMGVSDALLTYVDAGRIAEDEGAAAVALHARTAEQLYDGAADWEAVARLKRAVTSIPVLGNGDVWEGWDALRMMRATGCDGVVVGRGCLGRPWIFRDLTEVFAGREPTPPPDLGAVADLMLEHAEQLALWYGERRGLRAFRKHATWYTKGFAGSTRLRERLTRVATLAGLRAELERLERSEPFPAAALRVPRGKHGGRQRVVLPEGFLDDLQDGSPLDPAAEDPVSGG